MKYDTDQVRVQKGKIAPPSVIRPANTNEKPQQSDTKSKK
jgi:hypothetical protein